VSALRDLENKIYSKVNPAVSFSVRRYVLAVGIFVAVAVFGIIAILGLGVDLLPAVNIPAVIVRTSYPGATPSVVDQQVTQVIENVVSTLSGITDLNSTSSIGLSRVIVAFDPNMDKNTAANQVATLVSAAIKALPAGVTPPTIQTFDPNSQPIFQFGISGEGQDLAEVSDYVENTLSPNLTRVSGVANVQIDGGPTKQFQVLLNPDKLRFYGITPQQVVTAITTSALNAPIGTIVSHNNALTFSTLNTPTGLEQISRTLVDSGRGISVDTLGSVRSAPAATNYARVNGKPQVLVSILRTTDANSVAVVDNVRKVLAGTILPKGYLLTVSNDTTGPIKASVQSTYKELFNTVLVVALIVLLFLGKLNTAFSVILAIPISLSAAPVLYRLSGFSFNLVSLLALIIAIGIVVDDSIVVSENVERYRVMGFGLKESVLKGASEVFSAVVAASLSLLSVLIPVSFLGGFIGRYLQQFSLGLAAAVAFSLLEALLFLTVRLAYTPESRNLGWKDFGRAFTTGWRELTFVAIGIALLVYSLWGRNFLLAAAVVIGYYPVSGLANYVAQPLIAMLHGWTEAGLGWIRDHYARSLGPIMERGVWVLVGAGAFLLAVGILVVPRIPFNFVPQTDGGTMSVSLRLPSGSPAALTNELAGRLESWLMQRPEIVTVQTVVGNTGGLSGAFAGSNSANLTVQLVSVDKRKSVFELIPAYRAQLLPLVNRDQPSAFVGLSAGGGFGGFGSSLQLNIVAADFNTLLDRNNRIIQAIQANAYVTDVRSSLSDTSLENDFVPDPSRLKGTGITPAMIAAALQTYTSGTQASNVVSGGLSYPIQVQADPTSLSSGQSLLNLPVYSPVLQTNLQIGQLGGFVLNQAPVSVSRYNRSYTGSLTVNLKPNAPPALAMQTLLTDQLTRAGLVGGDVSLSSGGRFNPAALAAELMTTGPIAFLLALFLAYLVMAAQFNSWRYPIYLLLPVPLAIIGAFLLVFFMGGGLDIFGVMGMLMLIGLSAKNAILYLDFVVTRIGTMPFKDALIEAARLRFRPIIMTTMTVLVISFPLILGKGEGSEFGQRMGVVMLGGIVFSAVLTFFVVPAAFYKFERKRVARIERNAEAAREAGGEDGNGEGEDGSGGSFVEEARTLDGALRRP
jgi:hydrophobic/amphiphilic exporter-1 (mainly G- bacteria), HAE1 family